MEFISDVLWDLKLHFKTVIIVHIYYVSMLTVCPSSLLFKYQHWWFVEVDDASPTRAAGISKNLRLSAAPNLFFMMNSERVNTIDTMHDTWNSRSLRDL